MSLESAARFKAEHPLKPCLLSLQWGEQFALAKCPKIIWVSFGICSCPPDWQTPVVGDHEPCLRASPIRGAADTSNFRAVSANRIAPGAAQRCGLSECDGPGYDLRTFECADRQATKV